jgi:hypothetical protein
MGPQTAYSRTAIAANTMTVCQTIGAGVYAISFKDTGQRNVSPVGTERRLEDAAD